MTSLRAFVRTSSLVMVLAVLAAGPQLARAQTAAERSLARDQFQEGVRAAREGDWERAAEAFQRSYELAPRPTTLLNLAGAYTQIGRLVEAAEAYRMFLHEDGITARQRRDAEEQLAEVEPRVPRARLRVLGIEDDDRVTLDEYQLSLAALDELYPVDPGRHTVTVERERHEPLVVTFTAAEGAEEDVEVDARAEIWLASETAGSEGGDRDGPSIVEEPVFWIVLGSSVAVVGLVIGLAVGLGTPPEPYSGNTPPFRVELP